MMSDNEAENSDDRGARLAAQAELRRQRILARQQAAKEAKAKRDKREPDAEQEPVPSPRNGSKKQSACFTLLLTSVRIAFVFITALLAGLCRHGIFILSITSASTAVSSTEELTVSPRPSPWELFLAFEAAVTLSSVMGLFNSVNSDGFDGTLQKMNTLVALATTFTQLLRDLMLFFVVATIVRWAAVPMNLHGRLPLGRIPLSI